MSLKVAFDFDDTLDDWKHDSKMQELAKILIAGGAEVYIITARCPDPSVNNIDVLQIADNLKIPYENIIMTDLRRKYSFMKEIGCDIIFDNNWQEIHDVNSNGGMGLLVNFNPFEVLREEQITSKKDHKKYPC